jgi:uncharacterized membrane protein YvlD (DUF360 family)
MTPESESTYAEPVKWTPQAPRFQPLRLGMALLVGAVAVLVAAAIVPGVTVKTFLGALEAAVLIGILNAVLPPLVASLRLPLTLILGFFAVLIVDALILLLVSALAPQDFKVDSFGWALLAALVMSAAGMVLQVFLGVDDDDVYSLRVIQRVAKRQGERVRTDVPGIIFLEIDGLAAPVLRRAMRDGNTPVLARWLADGSHGMLEWEPDLSSQTGASQAGILLGSNEDIPAFRWVEKETGKMMTCSAPDDCAEIERRLATGAGLLVGGGASRGNLLSGEADEVILTVSRMDADKKANPGYRAFLANGFNVTRELVLFFWEVLIEYSAAARQRRRDVIPRGHRGGRYPYLRAVLCVLVRDLIVFGVVTDMMRGRPAVYATFSSYDEVAHHSGLERVDTLEALRKLDKQFGRIEKAARYAPRPYKLVVLSDHGQTQGMTFLQRNGYGLDDLVERSLSRGDVMGMGAGDEHDKAVGQAFNEATGRSGSSEDEGPSTSHVIVLGSGNLGLVYLMEENRRLTAEEIEERHPNLIGALRAHPHIGLLLMHSAEHGPIAVGATGIHYLADGRVEGDDPLAMFSPYAADHLRRTDGFPHVADIMINSFYDPDLDQGCAFEELISFHGGLGGPQTRPFVLYPVELPVPEEPIIGAAGVHGLLTGWRRLLQGEWRALPDESVTELGPAPAGPVDAPAEPQRPPVRPGSPPPHR